MDFSEKYGKSEEEAVELALNDLNIDKNKVKIIVLEKPSKGFLGIGSRPAKVRVEIIKENKKIEKSLSKPTNKTVEEKVVLKKEDIKQKKEIERKVVREKTYSKKISQNEPENLEIVTEHPALAFLKETTDKMGLTLELSARANEEHLYIDITGKDAGTIIGKRGQTLDAIQYLTSLVANKDNDKYLRVVVDAENYRAKREKTLEQLAERLAGKVVKTGKPVRLEPMNPYERMVIHATLQDEPEIVTKSEGDEPYRRVIIELK